MQERTVQIEYTLRTVFLTTIGLHRAGATIQDVSFMPGLGHKEERLRFCTRSVKRFDGDARLGLYAVKNLELDAGGRIGTSFLLEWKGSVSKGSYMRGTMNMRRCYFLGMRNR